MDDVLPADMPEGGDSQDEGGVIDSRALLAAMRAKHMSRNAIIDELMKIGLTLDEATDAFDDDVRVRLARVGGELRRLDAGPPPEPVTGIGGWLLIPALNLVLLVVLLIRRLVQALELLDALDGSAFTPDGLRTRIVGLIAAEAAVLALVLVTAWFFFRRHRWAPRLFIALLLVLVGLTILSAVGSEAEPDSGSPPPLLSMVVFAAVWIPYFLRSERVRNTFVR